MASAPPSRADFSLIGVLAALVLAHPAAFVPSEPYFNNDETRHVMTGVCVRDVLLDRPAPAELRGYTIGYYLQYPALGLLVWPPAFYGIEGVVFLIFGDSFLAARLLAGAFALLACVYLFLLVQRTHGRGTAAAAALVFGLSPQVFLYADRVMLEMPTLAWSLMAAFHFQRYLEAERKRDLTLCCLAAALAALTRFDGIFLLPFFLIWLIAARKLKLLGRRPVLIGIALAILAVAPFYCLTFREFGAAHLLAVKEGTSAASTGFLALENFLYYPLNVPRQFGWAALLPLAVGLAGAWRSERRAASWPYLALALAVYLTFTPMAELEERHSIYWVPALALFAVEGCRRIAEWFGRGGGAARLLVFAVLLGIAVQTWIQRPGYVFGYEKAAQFVAEHSKEPVCFFDGFLNGGFIYHLRRHDPERRLWVLRGDKLLYGMLSDPHAAYEEHAKTQEEVLALLFRYDPEFLVVEEPQIHFDLPAARLLRQTLKDHPDRFRWVKVFAIESDHPLFEGHELHIYRNSIRNPNQAPVLELKVLGLGRSLEAPMKQKE